MARHAAAPLVATALAVAALACQGDARPAPGAPAGAASGSASGAAGSAGGAAARATEAECLAVRDRVVELTAAHYVRHPGETWDGLDRSDPGIREGLPPDLVKENFPTFLASEAGQAWMARAKERARTSPGMAAAVERCVAGGTSAHVACWLGAASITDLQRCPGPG